MSLFVVAVAFAACGGDTHTPGDPLRTVPVDADLALIVPSLARLQAGAAAFLGDLPGATGVLELVAERWGIDLRTPDGLRAGGLDNDKGAVVWTPAGAVGAAVLALPVRDARAFQARIDLRLGRSAGGSRRAMSDDATWTTPRIYEGPTPAVAAGAAALPAWRAAWAVTDDGIGIVALTGGDGDPVGLYNRAAGERGGLVAEPDGRFAHAKSTAGPDAAIYLLAKDVLPETPAALGFAKSFVDNIRNGLALWQGGIVVASDRVALRFASDYRPPAGGADELPVSWVAPAGAADVIAMAVPKTTTALLRFRINLAKLRALPSFILSQVLPDQIPGLEMLPIPALSDVIEIIEGDVGVAFLGIDPKATFGHLTSFQKVREKALETFRVALVARLRDAAGMKRQFGYIADQLGTSGWVVAAIDPAKSGGYAGWTFVRGETVYSVLIDDKVVVFILGPGEVDAFIAAKTGRMTTLGEFGRGFDGVIQEVLGLAPAASATDTTSQGTAFGLALGFLRVTRELGDKGVPPYFLKMLSRIRLVGLGIDAQPKRVTFSLEVAR